MNHRLHLAVLVLAVLMMIFPSACGRRSEPVLTDSFESPGDAWGDVAGDGWSRGHVENEYYFDLQTPRKFGWTTSGKAFRDARVLIEARLVSGSKDNHMGVLCRVDRSGSFYYLAISSDGYYGIFRRLQSGLLEAINVSGGMVYSPLIRTGTETNLIEAICDGEQLSLSVNGKHLETVTDRMLRKGRVGFGVGSGLGEPVRVHFDSLAIYAW